MATVNLVLLLGRLIRDPRTHVSPDAESFVNVTLMTGGTDPQDAESQRTEWHRVDVLGALATAAQYLRKGDRVYVEGRLRSRARLDGDRREKCVAIVAEKMQAIGKPSGRDRVAAPRSKIPCGHRTIEDIWIEIRSDVPF